VLREDHSVPPKPNVVITGHGHAMQGALMQKALNELAIRFDDVARRALESMHRPDCASIGASVHETDPAGCYVSQQKTRPKNSVFKATLTEQSVTLCLLAP
jgi:hypothetical protein